MSIFIRKSEIRKNSITGIAVAALTLLASGFFDLATAQNVYTFDEAKQSGLRISHLDSNYVSGIHADTAKGVFKTGHEEYLKAYRALLSAIAVHLEKTGFSFTGELKVFNRFYFGADGKIDYVLYKIRPGQTSPEQDYQFQNALESFVPAYKFPIASREKFSQCGSATYVLGSNQKEHSD